MWYETKEKAEEACEKKRIDFPDSEFYVLKDSKEPNCWWAARKMSDHLSQNASRTA